jgi:hypothetical protein
MKKPRAQGRMSDAAVKERSGKTWAEWFKILDEAGAKKMDHTAITEFLYKKHKVPGWWCQMIAVDYEHARGIRAKFQKCDGAFATGGSRTLNVSMAKLFQAWSDEKLRSKWLPDAQIEITKATPGKSVRAKWDGGKSRLSVNFYAKGAGKSQVAVDHENLASAKECAAMKNYWFEALNRLQALMTA